LLVDVFAGGDFGGDVFGGDVFDFDAPSGESSENHWSSSLEASDFDEIPGTSTLEWHLGQSMREPAIDEGALSLALHCGQLIRIGSWDGWLTKVTQT
jgi:hypothetical protein